MKKGLFIGIFIAAASLTLFAQQDLKGYLSDVLCGVAGYPEGYQGQIDLAVDPEKNVVACIVMDNCRATGFGLYLLQENGKYMFHRFDKESSEVARKQVLPRLKDKMAPAPYIELIGTITSSGELRGVKKISIIKGPATTGSGGMGNHRM
jgi:hypothetical protein